MRRSIYHHILERRKDHKKSFAVLIDPDKVVDGDINHLVSLATEAGVDYFFVGGSLVVSQNLDECVLSIKRQCEIPDGTK